MSIAFTTSRGKVDTRTAETWESEVLLSFFLILLVSVAFVLPALGLGRDHEHRYSNIGFSLVLISGVAFAWMQHKFHVAMSLVAIVALTVRWIAWLTPSQTLDLWSDLWTMTAIVVMSLLLLRKVFSPGHVTHLRIQGAIAVYLLFGVAWAHAYHVTATLDSSSFKTAGGEFSSIGNWALYSFATLTTIGYGNVTPRDQIAWILSIAEALLGQLYIAVSIARLVALEVIYSTGK